MFEQSLLLDSGHGAKARAVVLSLTTQTAVAGALLLVPLIYTERLAMGPITLPTFLPQAPAPPPVQHKPVAQRPTAIHRVFPGIFVPRYIPPLNTNFIPEPDPGPITFEPGPLIPVAVPFATALAPPPQAPRVVQTEIPGKPVPVSGTLQAAKLIHKVVPTYPALAKMARISGTVHLLGIIGADGRIEQLQVSSGPPLLVQAAVEAVKQWLYSPTLLNERPVEVSAPIDVIFTLSQ